MKKILKKFSFFLVFSISALMCFSAMNAQAAIKADLGEQKKKWEVKTGEQRASLHFEYKNRLYILAGDYIAVGNPNKTLLCVDAKRGRILWKKRQSRKRMEMDTTLTLKKRTVLWHFRNSKRAKFYNPKNGRLIKVRKMKNTLPYNYSVPSSVKKGKFIFSIENFKVLTCKNSEGKTLWKWQKANLNINRIAVSGNKIYFSAMPGRKIYALDINNQKVVGIYNVPITRGAKDASSIQDYSFVVKNNVLYLGLYSGKIQAYKLKFAK